MSTLEEEITSPNANPGVLVAEGGDIWKDGEQGTCPPKSRCEASCRGLRGTGMESSQGR
jgi:hypothetical protein